MLLPLQSLLAEELRVIDDRGLLRAFLPSEQHMSVRITVVPEGLEESNGLLILRQIDGLAEDIAIELEDLSCSAYSVSPGTWQIEGVRGKFIRSVVIEPLLTIPLPDSEGISEEHDETKFQE